LPPATARVDNFTHGSIGISFACRRSVFEKCQFTRGRGEDFRMLRDIRDKGFRIKLSNYLTYLVRQDKISKKSIELRKKVEKELFEKAKS